MIKRSLEIALLLIFTMAPLAIGAGRDICSEKWVPSFHCEGSKPPPIEETPRAKYCSPEWYSNNTSANDATKAEHEKNCKMSYPTAWKRLCGAYHRNCESSGGGSGHNECNGSADCMKKARETQKGGENALRDKIKSNRDAISEMEDAMKLAMLGASGILDNWKRANSSDPQSAAAFNHDLNLVNKAADAMTGASNTFSSADADQAKDTGIQQHLGFAAESREVIDILNSENSDLEKQQKELHVLGDKTGERADNLENISTDTRGGGLQRGLAGTAGPIHLAAAVAHGPALNSKSDITGTSEPKLDSTKSDKLNKPDSFVAANADSIGIGASFSGRLSNSASSLRDLLRSRMESSASAAEPAMSLDGRKSLAEQDLLGLHLGDGAGAGVSEAGMATNDTPAGSNSGHPAFSLGAGSEAEIHRLVAGGTVESEAFPGANSPDLFTRVRQAHRACLARTCVR